MFGSKINKSTQKISYNKWEVFIDKGREETGLDVLKWAKFAEKSGAGEIHINSIDNDGTFNGFDYDLVKKLSKIIKLPLVIGGLGRIEHIDRLLRIKNIEGVSASSALHYKKLTIYHIKQQQKII